MDPNAENEYVGSLLEEAPADESCKVGYSGPLKLAPTIFPNPVFGIDGYKFFPIKFLSLDSSLLERLARWSKVAAAISQLELDSGSYENWAQEELGNPRSPLNAEGLEIAQALSTVRKCYYVISEFKWKQVCPICGQVIESSGQSDEEKCEKCGIVVSHQGKK